MTASENMWAGADYFAAQMALEVQSPCSPDGQCAREDILVALGPHALFLAPRLARRHGGGGGVLSRELLQLRASFLYSRARWASSMVKVTVVRSALKSCRNGCSAPVEQLRQLVQRRGIGRVGALRERAAAEAETSAVARVATARRSWRSEMLRLCESERGVALLGVVKALAERSPHLFASTDRLDFCAASVTSAPPLDFAVLAELADSASDQPHAHATPAATSSSQPSGPRARTTKKCLTELRAEKDRSSTFTAAP